MTEGRSGGKEAPIPFQAAHINGTCFYTTLAAISDQTMPEAEGCRITMMI